MCIFRESLGSKYENITCPSEAKRYKISESCDAYSAGTNEKQDNWKIPKSYFPYKITVEIVKTLFSFEYRLTESIVADLIYIK